MKLTKEVITQIESEVQTRIEAEYNEQLKLYNDGERGIKDFNNRYLDNKREDINILNFPLEGLKEAIRQSEEFYDSLKDEIGRSINTDYSYYDEYATYDIVVERYELKKKDDLKYMIKPEIMKRVSNILYSDIKEKGYDGYERSLDCKVLDLFINGAIDYETLIELTYKDCKLFS